ncbi:MAG: UDP-3-O-(3-hydroxymyristoyl)glucosamine N-acyltransferase [Nitrospira sp.]|nr:UDP-3-O-(3-hydroxymyristoyl)glucosamine N-acyltransferase [Candidatus Manganitrophaceae bacterium]HIL35547.1 UDP-3-O-(3-hydroxymyristoyl)glucosamine N-acyltransferase [Candidatus Manganitrophaceae bacterium]
MAISLSEIAKMLEGRVIGDPHLRITGVSSIEEAMPGDITFVSNPRYRSWVASTQASALIIPEEIQGVSASLLLVENPYYAFAQLLAYFHPAQPHAVGIDSRVSMGEGVVLGEKVSIGPFVTLEDGVTIGEGVRIGSGVFVGEGSEVGDSSLIYPNVTLREGVKIGKRVIIHCGTVVGSDGFGFVPRQGRYHKVPQVGGVIVEDDVELGANVTVDRATMGNTVIGRGTKVDNLVQIGHNVLIGEDTILVSQVGISGSTEIGRHVTLAGQVGVAGHLKIGDQVIVGGKSGITKDIPSGETVSGFPPVPHKAWLKAQATFRKLPALRNQVRALEEKITRLEKGLSPSDHNERTR